MPYHTAVGRPSIFSLGLVFFLLWIHISIDGSNWLKRSHQRKSGEKSDSIYVDTIADDITIPEAYGEIITDDDGVDSPLLFLFLKYAKE